jgi:hypothetical protein
VWPEALEELAEITALAEVAVDDPLRPVAADPAAMAPAESWL